MTTVKEFENRKKSIISCAEVAIGYINEEEYDDAQGLLESILTLTKQLQLPLPPCSTCNYINLECDSNTYGGFLCKNLNALNADGKVASTSGGYNIRIKDIKNFGCNQHSDFEVNNE